MRTSGFAPVAVLALAVGAVVTSNSVPAAESPANQPTPAPAPAPPPAPARPPAPDAIQFLRENLNNGLSLTNVAPSMTLGVMAALPRSNVAIPGPSAWQEGPLQFPNPLDRRANSAVETIIPSRVGAGAVAASMGLNLGLSLALGANPDDVGLNTGIAGISNYGGMRIAYGLAGQTLETSTLVLGTGLGMMQAFVASGIQVVMKDSPSVYKAGATGVGVSGSTAIVTYVVTGSVTPAAPAIILTGICAGALCAATDYLGGTWKSIPTPPLGPPPSPLDNQFTLDNPPPPGFAGASGPLV
jgi:hypothetical protein